MTHVRRLLKSLVLILLSGAFMMVVFVYAAMLMPETAQPADCLIVPGCKVSGLTPSLSLDARLRRALALYREGYAPYLIVCGARGEGEAASEATVMRAYLIAHGVPPNAILADERSFSTEQNMINAKALMDTHGFESAVIVTSDFHAARAKACAFRAGIRPVYTAKARFWWYKKWWNTLREIPGWGKFILTGLYLIEP